MRKLCPSPSLSLPKCDPFAANGWDTHTKLIVYVCTHKCTNVEKWKERKTKQKPMVDMIEDHVYASTKPNQTELNQTKWNPRRKNHSPFPDNCIHLLCLGRPSSVIFFSPFVAGYIHHPNYGKTAKKKNLAKDVYIYNKKKKMGKVGSKQTNKVAIYGCLNAI